MGPSVRFVLAAMLVLAFPMLARADGPVGTVQILYGDALLSRNGAPQQLRLGTMLFEGDHLETLKGRSYRDHFSR